MKVNRKWERRNQQRLNGTGSRTVSVSQLTRHRLRDQEGQTAGATQLLPWTEGGPHPL